MLPFSSCILRILPSLTSTMVSVKVDERSPFIVMSIERSPRLLPQFKASTRPESRPRFDFDYERVSSGLN